MAKTHKVKTATLRYELPDFIFFEKLMRSELGRLFLPLIQRKALLRGARRVVTLARKDVPVLSGRLKKSLAVGPYRQGINSVVAFGARRPESSRLHLAEFGFRHKGGVLVPGRYFYTRVLEKQAGAIRSAVFLAAKVEWRRLRKIIGGAFEGIPTRIVRVLEQ